MIVSGMYNAGLESQDYYPCLMADYLLLWTSLGLPSIDLCFDGICGDCLAGLKTWRKVETFVARLAFSGRADERVNVKIHQIPPFQDALTFMDAILPTICLLSIVMFSVTAFLAIEQPTCAAG